MRSRFGNPSDGLRASQSQDGFSALIPVDDSELSSANAMALQFLVRLSHRLPDPQASQSATRLAAALAGHAIEFPGQRAGILTAISEAEDGETGAVRYLARGAVRVAFHTAETHDALTAVIDLGHGWHINAHKPLEDYLIPTTFRLKDTASEIARYPEPVVRSLRFNAKPMALYENSVRLVLPLAPNLPKPAIAELELQPCNDEMCLPPETLRYVVWAP